MKTIFLLFISILFTINSMAQENKISGPWTWKTIEAFPGTQITDAIAILAKQGLPDVVKVVDSAYNEVIYSFYAPNVKYKAYEPIYALTCSNDKIIFVTVSYQYAGNNSFFLNDINEMRKTLKENGFKESAEKSLERNHVYNYNANKKNNNAALIIDNRMAVFYLIFGDPKLVKLATEME